MAIARFLDRMCLALRASGLWLRYATLQNLILSFPWIAPPHPPPWRNPRKGRDQILPCGNHALALFLRSLARWHKSWLTGADTIASGEREMGGRSGIPANSSDRSSHMWTIFGEMSAAFVRPLRSWATVMLENITLWEKCCDPLQPWQNQSFERQSQMWCQQNLLHALLCSPVQAKLLRSSSGRRSWNLPTWQALGSDFLLSLKIVFTWKNHIWKSSSLEKMSPFANAN